MKIMKILDKQVYLYDSVVSLISVCPVSDFDIYDTLVSNKAEGDQPVCEKTNNTKEDRS